ncbi:hypothetical protein [Saccharopolyspora endophytica]|uniref:Uncharacterized protein n=1 Tax=Saccharopolyspora endophytica TaxID=543886 RepID=A0ABS5DH86_9PSEU|nr:hypothetical protein [Saccharopolyspora endophytica]MBQ0925605.1 hypothetical protein [Saccharopolyspora endophytica]
MGQETLALIEGANKISAARGQLDNGKDEDIEVDGKANIVPANGNGIAFGRTPGEVLNIVYLTPGAATKGGFFPSGVNGELNSAGGADTGGGGTADEGSNGAVIGAGAGLLAAGAGAAAYAAHQRSAGDEETTPQQQ